MRWRTSGAPSRSRGMASSAYRPRTGRAATALRRSRTSHQDSRRRSRFRCELGMQPVQGARLVEASAAFVTVDDARFPRGRSDDDRSRASCSRRAVRDVGDARDPRLGAERAALSRLPGAHARRDGAQRRATLARWDRGPALAAMTRYAGISAIGAVALWSVARRGTLAERLRRGAWALLPAAVLEGLWFVRTKLVVHGGADPWSRAVRQPRRVAQGRRDDARVVARPRRRWRARPRGRDASSRGDRGRWRVRCSSCSW